MKLFHKIFLTYLLVSFVLLASVLGAMKFSARRYFEEMEKEFEGKAVSALIHDLAAAYTAQGDWQRFRQDPRIFDHSINLLARQLQQFHGGFEPPPEPSGPGPFHGPLHGRLTLLARDRTRIAGAPLPAAAENPEVRPIRVNDEIVGFVSIKKSLHHPFSPPLQERLAGLYIAGSILFILGGIVSFILSRYILSPVKQLTCGTRALTRFEFQTRIKVNTRDELGRLAADFNHMAGTLERYESMKKQWMTDISHELRTPLSVLKGEIEALQDGIHVPDQSRLSSLHAEVCYLETIVNDLHHLSMAEAGTLGMNMGPAKPVKILLSVLSAFQTRLQQSQLTTDICLNHRDTVMHGDRIKLKQLFSNILENNIQYTRRPGTVSIRDSFKSGQLTITIGDSGPGVPEQSLDKIFDRLYRVDASRSSGKKNGRGSGLGLSICRAVARGHGGEISPDINKDGGLTLTIRLPADQA